MDNVVGGIGSDLEIEGGEVVDYSTELEDSVSWNWDSNF